MSNILIASFIFPERLDWFLDYLEKKFKIKKGDVFIFKNLDDEAKLMVTFKFMVNPNHHINIKNLFPSAIPIHKKGLAIYTINALNKLIENELCDNVGNIDYKNHKIDWSKYQGKLILIDNKELVISNIERIFI